MLLNEEVGGCRIYLEASRKRDRAEGIVRRDSAVVKLCHNAYLSALEDTAAMADIGLNDADGLLLNKLSELPLAEESFACRDRNSGGACYIYHAVNVLGEAGLLDEEGIIRLKRLGESYSHSRAYSAVEVDSEVDIVSDSLAHRRKAFNVLEGVCRAFNVLYGRDYRVLERRISVGKSFVGDSEHIFNREFSRNACTLNMGIHSDPIPCLSAEKLVDGAVVVLTLDIPHSLLDTADSRKHNGAAAIESALVKSLNVMLYHHGILADEIILILLYHRLNGIGVTFKNRLSETYDVGIRVHFEEHPSRFYFD